MKLNSLVPVLFVVICIFSTRSASAQYYNSHEFGNNELYLGDGLVTVEQANGWSGRGGLTGYVSMPSAITGAVFFTYRHFFTKRFAVGVTGGLDNLSGDLSYGNPETSATGYDGVSGHYSVHSYSLAVEALFAYFRREKVMLYGYTGVGATSFEEKYTIYANAPYGPPVQMPSNPYDYHVTYFNAQVTPFGVRFGGTVAGFFELGFGYKGLMSGGLSVRF